MNLNLIKTNSRQVYNILLHYTRCTFNQLQKLCNLASTDTLSGPGAAHEGKQD